MTIFFTLFFKLLPLYTLIVMGYIAAKTMHIDKEHIAKLLLYFLTPVVFFTAVTKAPIELNSLSLPILYFILPSLFCWIAYCFSKFFWKDTTRNIFAFTAGGGNTGYFGLPVAIMLFDERVVGLYIMGVMGVNLYESITGLFITARGHHTVRESIVKVIQLPSLYAFILGVFFNVLQVTLPTELTDFLSQFRGCYTILGMMMIGMGLAGFKRMSFDGAYILLTLLIRFIAWPCITLSLLWLDQSFIHFLSPDIYRVMILLSIVPLAANTVALASLFKLHPEKASLAVLISTFVALFYIPVMVSIFLPY